MPFFIPSHLKPGSKDWNTTLKEYLPIFLNAENELEYELAALQIIGDINDTHANIWGGADKIKEQRGDYFPAVHVRFIEDKLTVVDYYNPELKDKVGLDIGDVITTINGELVSDLIKEKTPYYLNL